MSLTDDGTELVDRYRATVTAAVGEHLASWPASRRQQLATLARATVDALK